MSHAQGRALLYFACLLTVLLSIDIALRLGERRSARATSQPPASSGDTLTVRKIRVVDSDGNERAVLGTDDESYPELVFRDADGTPRLDLSTSENQPSLGLFGPKGEERSYFLLYEDGTPAMLMFDADRKERVSLELDGSGDNPQLSLKDASEAPIWHAP